MKWNNDNLNTFVFNFLKKLNNDKNTEIKPSELLTYISSFFNFKNAFVYQTDGFRYFYLKESVGNNGNLPVRIDPPLKNKKAIGYLKSQSVFYIPAGAKNEYEEHILSTFNLNSVFLKSFSDASKKIIGFLGFGDSQRATTLTQEEVDALSVVSGLLAKEISTREYEERGIRATNTLNNIMNNMGADIYVNSFDDHDMLYANESMAAPYGGQEAFSGKKCWEALYTDKTGECDFCPKRHLIDEDGLPTKVYSWDYKRPFDGSWFRVFSAAFDWVDGQLAHVITSLDITHRKQLEEELLKAKDRAEYLDQLKSSFLANMSHEIRTPLNAIVGFSDLLVEEEEINVRREYMRVIKNSNDLLLDLIEDILDLSKMESGKIEFTMEDVNVNELCRDIAQSYKVTNKSTVPVVFYPNGEYTIYTDRKRLTQVITNFVNNALKFTSKGDIIIKYEPVYIDKDGTGEINALKFSVIDQGTGIAPEKAINVFDRFVKLDNNVKGTGLGLSICKNIVEYLNGEIGVNSELGVGSTFWFTHPLPILS